MSKYTLPKHLSFGDLPCFVCNTTLDKSNFTLEHIIPQWMIRAFKLEDATITHPSGEKTRYMDYTIPCCENCNNTMLGQIESDLAPLFKQENSGPRDAPIDALAIWACKIFAANHIYNGASARQADGRLLDEIDSVSMARTYLGMRTDKVVFRHKMLKFPFSLFIFATKVPELPEKQFDFKVFPAQDALYLRVRNWCMLARCDGGYLQLHGDRFFAKFQKETLSPVQSDELAAHFFTMSERQAYNLKYVKREEENRTIIEYVPILHQEPFVNVDGEEDLRFWLAETTRLPADKLFPGNGRITFLVDEFGDFLDLDPDY